MTDALFPGVIAVIRIESSMLRMEFSNGNMTQVPAHEGLGSLFDETKEYALRNGLDAMSGRTLR